MRDPWTLNDGTPLITAIRQKGHATMPTHDSAFAQCQESALVAACVLRQGHDGPHVAPNESAKYQEDLTLILRALDLGDHARPYSPHQVVITEVLPAIERLRVSQHGLEMARRAMREAVIWLKSE